MKWVARPIDAGDGWQNQSMKEMGRNFKETFFYLFIS
jgi:hypothetical protein